jgi:hypothetical protein
VCRGGQRVSEQCLKNRAGHRQRAADERGRQNPGQPGDEENLGIRLSANGIEPSNTRRSEIDVEPRSGAPTSATRSSRRNPPR